MPVTFGSGGISGSTSSFLKLWEYDNKTRRAAFNGSIEVLPSSFYMGENFRLSNGITAVAFKLADGNDGLGLVNRYTPDEGSRSNPVFYALGAQETVDINLISTNTLANPIEVAYTTVGDNLTYDFDIIPASTGTLHVEYWLGTDATGSKVFDEVREITQAEVDANVPISFGVGNAYIIPAGTDVFVRLQGVDLKGSATLPYFVSKVLPYTEVTLGGHVEVVETDITLFIGCKYACFTPNNTTQTLTVPAVFKDTFEVFDPNELWSETTKLVVDFSAFDQGVVEIQAKGTHITFYYREGSGWYLIDHKTGNNTGYV